MNDNAGNFRVPKVFKNLMDEETVKLLNISEIADMFRKNLGK